MAPGLRQHAQEDFSAGSVLSVARHLIPANGAYRILDGLLDDDGSVYRRGGSVFKSNAAFASSLRFLWDGYFPRVGLRTLVGRVGGWGVLSPGDDATPIALAGSGVSEPKVAVLAGDILWIGGGEMYGGSLKSAAYAVGSVTATSGSSVVTGAGTSWTANVDAGMLVEFSGDAQRYYVVQSVESNTQLTLTEPFLGTTGGGQAYVASAFKTAASSAGSGRGFVAAEFYAAVAGRLIAGVSNKVFMSAPINPASGRSRAQEFTAKDVHELPQGVKITGLAVQRDRALIFTTAGVWMLSGLAQGIVDEVGNPQHRLERVDTDRVLWGAPGVASSQNAVIAACTDGVYLLDGISGPVDLSRSVRTVIAAYVRAGHKPGQAVVYRNHLFLPVLSSASAVVDVMVCRLDRSVRTRLGDVFPWTFLRGHGGDLVALVARAAAGPTRSPKLLAAGGTRVLDVSSFFEPAGGVKNDADGSTHRQVTDTRDFPTGSGSNENTVVRLRARYALAGTAAPGVIARYSTGALGDATPTWGVDQWGEFAWMSPDLAEFRLLSGEAPVDAGQHPFSWSGWAAKALYVRFRIETTRACSSYTLRAVEFFVRESGRTR